MAAHVHHKRPVEEAPQLAFVWTNLQSVCVECHNRMDAPKNKCRVMVVFGPLGSGKSHYVAKHWKQGDLLIDLDKMIEALGATPRMYPDELMPFACAARDAVLQRLRHKHPMLGTAWIVTTSRTVLDQCVAELDATVVRMSADIVECIAQIRGDASRAHVLEGQLHAVQSWFDGTSPKDTRDRSAVHDA